MCFLIIFKQRNAIHSQNHALFYIYIQTYISVIGLDDGLSDS